MKKLMFCQLEPDLQKGQKGENHGNAIKTIWDFVVLKKKIQRNPADSQTDKSIRAKKSAPLICST